MRIKKEPEKIWREYQSGVSYKSGIDLYETVQRNNDFFNDIQWKGVKAPDLDKPVFNILKPIINYYTAMLISDDIALNVELMGKGKDTTIKMRPVGNEGKATKMPTDVDSILPKVITREVETILESANVRTKNRRMIRNCAVDGDACFYMWFDPEEETGYEYSGSIKVDLVDNTNVYFGNTTDEDVQSQPYILLSYRRKTNEVRDEAKANGLPIEDIVPDDSNRYTNADKEAEGKYTTVLLKLWKERGRVHLLKCTERALVKKEVDTGYRLYPVAWMSWEQMKNSYHGISPLTGKINNQIFINKIYALAMRYVANHAFPKVVYDESKLPQGWNNDVNKAISVVGNPNTAILSAFRPPDMSSDALQMAHMTIKETKELMGASDAALGNVRPDNTSAIIAVQKAAGLPLDIQRMEFHNFVESYVRILIDMMRVNYGVRNIVVTGDENVQLSGDFDFAMLSSYALNLRVDIGTGAYWSELMQIRTLDSLMSNKIMPDALTYLEAIPDGYVKDKDKIMNKIREAQKAKMQQQQPPQMPQMNQPIPQIKKGMPQNMMTPPSQARSPIDPPAIPNGKLPSQANVQATPPMQAGGGMPTTPAGQGMQTLTPEQLDMIIKTLVVMPREQAIEKLKTLPVAEKDKQLVLEVLEKIWSNQKNAPAGQQKGQGIPPEALDKLIKTLVVMPREQAIEKLKILPVAEKDKQLVLEVLEKIRGNKNG